MSDTENADDTFTLPDPLVLGAAADSASLNEELQRLPRLLRYALLSLEHRSFWAERLAADLAAIVPDLPVAPWVAEPSLESAEPLIAELDRRAATADRPELRGLADCLRLLSLPRPKTAAQRRAFTRVAAALLLANHELPVGTPPKLAARIETFVFGWAALPLAAAEISSFHGDFAPSNAWYIGEVMARRRIRVAEEEVRSDFEAREEEKAAPAAKQEAEASAEVPPDHLVVGRLPATSKKNTKLREVIGPFKDALEKPLPLVAVPALPAVRQQLLFEFPYAEEVIDTVLTDLVGQRTLRLRPLLLVGEPGGGKSRFARRLGEVLGLHVWRTDASRSDGAVFGGTDKRWYSAEPCHAFLAVAQAGHANPLVLIDELEKAGTRTDYGRLWDCLLGFLEPETAKRYPDPALQIELDLSQVSYVATANRLDPLPPPLRDRLRIIEFPKPTGKDLSALLPAVLADLAAERRLDPRWIAPLTGDDHDLIAAHWNGGSVRRLRRVIEVIIRAREREAVRN